MPETKYVRRYFKDTDDGRPSYFRRWSGIGPELTSDPGKAFVFDSPEAAASIRHSLCIMNTEKVGPDHPCAAVECEEGDDG